MTYDLIFLVHFLNFICIPITFDNPLKANFSNNKYLITIQTRQTQIVEVYFLLQTGFNTFLKIIGAQNQFKDIKG